MCVTHPVSGPGWNESPSAGLALYIVPGASATLANITENYSLGRSASSRVRAATHWVPSMAPLYSLQDAHSLPSHSHPLATANSCFTVVSSMLAMCTCASLLRFPFSYWSLAATPRLTRFVCLFVPAVVSLLSVYGSLRQRRLRQVVPRQSCAGVTAGGGAGVRRECAVRQHRLPAVVAVHRTACP